MNLTYVFEHGDAVLITTFLLLITMSLSSWYIIFWKLYLAISEKNILNSTKKILATQEALEENISTLKSQKLDRLVQAIYSLPTNLETYSSEKKKEIISLNFGQALDNIRTNREKALTLLASIGSSAPFIGLFGTVWGIYNALMKISLMGNASLNVVAGPIGEALIATAVGLFAAIPAVLAYNGFVRANRLIMQDYRHISEQLSFKLSMTNYTSQNKPNLKLVTGE